MIENIRGGSSYARTMEVEYFLWGVVGKKKKRKIRGWIIFKGLLDETFGLPRQKHSIAS